MSVSTNRFSRRASVLWLAALALLLAACGSAAPPAKPAEPAEQAGQAEPAAQEEVVVVVTATPMAAPQAVPTIAPPEEETDPVEASEAPPEPAEAPAAEEPVTVADSGSPPPGAVISNEEWTPQVERFDSIQYAMVPAGCFNMGTDDASDAEKPINEQCFDQPFWIGLTEVTNDQYGTDGSFSPDDYPRNYVTWFQAQSFCQSLGARLPTEAEWEYAARGPNGYKYPFGDVFLPGFVIHVDNAAGPESVGSQREGASWVGAFDMSGNIREWTSSAYLDYPYNTRDGREDPSPAGDPRRVVRGGSYMSGRDTVRLTMREWYDWNHDTADIGFRCARDFS